MRGRVREPNTLVRQWNQAPTGTDRHHGIRIRGLRVRSPRGPLLTQVSGLSFTNLLSNAVFIPPETPGMNCPCSAVVSASQQVRGPLGDDLAVHVDVVGPGRAGDAEAVQLVTPRRLNEALLRLI